MAGIGRVEGPNWGDGIVPLCPPDARIACGDPRRTGLRLLRPEIDIGRPVLHAMKWRALGGLRGPIGVMESCLCARPMVGWRAAIRAGRAYGCCARKSTLVDPSCTP